jgi:formylglycine-generating enzyme required for sulfatase activity
MKQNHRWLSWGTRRLGTALGIFLTAGAGTYFAASRTAESDGEPAAKARDVVVERSGSASRFKAKSSLDAKVEFVNSLGMKFARVPRTKVFFGVWDVRVRDYQAYAHSQPGDEGLWRDPGFRQESNHPVVMVSWAEAKAFCEWLSAKEGRRYRLPTDAEWSLAVGLGKESGDTPSEKGINTRDAEPRPTGWFPPAGSGNYGKALNLDPYDYTSPVGRFKANAIGLHDMGGNALQWCEDWYNAKKAWRVLRGSSWRDYTPDSLLPSFRSARAPDRGYNDVGFRCVLADE